MKLTSAMIKQRGMELGLDGVGIASMVQKGAPDADGRVQIVFVTHRAHEQAGMAALE